MVEFFDIPHIIASSNEDQKRDMYEWYCMTDYTRFNEGYKDKFDAFEKFLDKCGITRSINQNNSFMKVENNTFEYPPVINKEYIHKICKKLNLYSIPIKMINAKYNK